MSNSIEIWQWNVKTKLKRNYVNVSLITVFDNNYNTKKRHWKLITPTGMHQHRRKQQKAKALFKLSLFISSDQFQLTGTILWQMWMLPIEQQILHFPTCSFHFFLQSTTIKPQLSKQERKTKPQNQQPKKTKSKFLNIISTFQYINFDKGVWREKRWREK